MGFLLNHLGLWIVIAGASLGAGDMHRLNMRLQEGGEYTNRAVNNKNEVYQLKLAVRLLDFEMETYPPKLALLNKDFKFIRQEGLKMPLVEKGLQTQLLDWQVEVQDYYELAVKGDTTQFRPFPTMGAVPAVHVRATHAKSGQQAEGWLAGSSFLLKPEILKLGDGLSLALTEPEPKRYASVVEYITKEGQHDTATVEVNKPLKINGWKIYQNSYDASRGRWSQTSILELIYDPWLPVVYIGIFMMLAGGVYIFWIGRGK